MNEKEFNEMIEAENVRAGQSNVINAYSCYGCARETITRDYNNGTTPFQISCPSCGKTAVSKMYRVDQTLSPTHEFYRPSFREFQKLTFEKQHVEMGGLLFRKIDNFVKNQNAG